MSRDPVVASLHVKGSWVASLGVNGSVLVLYSVGMDDMGAQGPIVGQTESYEAAENMVAPGPAAVRPRGLAGRIADELISWVKTLASAAVYATLIVTFGFQVARVDGQSMAPTLQNHDRLIVNKLAYRVGDPKVGDIVMLLYPNDPEKTFVKRVVAEEGDQVKIVNGKVYRNGAPMDDSFVLPEYRSHEDFGPTVIRQGYYFVMGDHRNSSSDSRIWGEVPKKYIIGRVQVRWWPLPDARTF